MSSEFQKPFSDEGRKRFDEIFRKKPEDRDEAAMLEALSGGHPLEPKPFVARIKSDDSEPVECLSCGWTGIESEIIEVQHYPEDSYMIAGEMVEVCPKCKSAAWGAINAD